MHSCVLERVVLDTGKEEQEPWKTQRSESGIECGNLYLSFPGGEGHHTTGERVNGGVQQIGTPDAALCWHWA